MSLSGRTDSSTSSAASESGPRCSMPVFMRRQLVVEHAAAQCGSTRVSGSGMLMDVHSFCGMNP